MRVLVIGGTAFMGPFVVRQLAASGHDVTVVHRGRSEPEFPAEVRHLHIESSGLADRSGLLARTTELRSLRPDVVLDMIAMTESSAAALIDLFRGVARRLVVASSLDVYLAYGRIIGTEPGDPVPVPLTETSPLRERLYPYRTNEAQGWVVDYDKILVERLVQADPALPGTVLRLPMVYGPGDGQHRTRQYLDAMDRGEPIITLEPGEAAWRTTRGYAEDMAAAIVRTIVEDRAAGRTYNLGDADALSEAEWVRAIAQAADWTGEIHVAEGDATPPQDLVADTSRIRQELGEDSPLPREQALRRTIAWERSVRQ